MDWSWNYPGRDASLAASPADFGIIHQRTVLTNQTISDRQRRTGYAELNDGCWLACRISGSPLQPSSPAAHVFYAGHPPNLDPRVNAAYILPPWLLALFIYTISSLFSSLPQPQPRQLSVLLKRHIIVSYNLPLTFILHPYQVYHVFPLLIFQ